MHPHRTSEGLQHSPRFWENMKNSYFTITFDQKMPQSMILQALRTNAIPSNFQGVEGGGKGTFINDVTHVRGRGSRFFQKVILGDQRGVGVSRK